MISKTVALERCLRVIQRKLNQHGYLQPSELRDSLLELADELQSEPDDDEPAPPDA